MNMLPTANVAPTPKDTVFENGTAKLYHFRGEGRGEANGLPVLLVPSMINRWYVLDLRPGASLVEALVDAGLDVWCLDWGIPQDEDRYLTWDEVVARLGRMVRRVKRETGAPKVGVLGYCMGGTLTAIYSALEPENVATLVSLTAPVDFSRGGLLSELVDERWFDPEAITAGGNLPAPQMQTGFTTLRPTGQISKWVLFADKAHDPAFVEGFGALEQWVGDNIPFPAAAYVTYIRELYQQNLLAKGEHYVGGERVDLSRIDCPLLTVTATRDTICPPEAGDALNERVGSDEVETLSVSGGHVGAVVGSKGPKVLYPAIADWFADKLGYKVDPELVGRARMALNEDDYNKMRSVLAETGSAPAVGTKAEIRQKLQTYLEGVV